MKTRKLLYLLMFTVLLLSMLSLPAAATPSRNDAGLDKVEALLLEELAARGQTDAIVWMAETADLGPADQLTTKAEKGQFVFDALRATAERTQQDLCRFLDGRAVDYEAFYIVNAILVRGVDQALLTELAARPDVAGITANHQFKLDEPFKEANPPPHTEAVEPNISFLNADDVWAMGITGQGIVMAGNDTGLDETHPAIAPHYRGCMDPPACTVWDHDYNWWDATGTYPTNPSDGFGHGTHTTGTMVGDDGGANQIGMAPGAQTIHCKNMDDGGYGNDAWFIECFEWDLAPWDLTGQNPDPAMAPDSVNNSWGYWGGGQNQLRPAVDALLAAGIVVEVSAGNEGSGCYTLRSPGDYEEVLTTGSVNHAYAYPGLLTGFSSRGPSLLDGDYFPDIMAPGENIRSAVPNGGYEYWGGTSMAGPHATALIGLLWSANPALRGQIDTTFQIIKDTAAPLTGQGGSNCGGDYEDGPNNDWGYGTIDAYQAVLLAIAMGGAGTLEGSVTDDGSGDPIEGAMVHAVHNEGFAWTVYTDENGFYQMTVAAGTFDVTASHPQYMAETVTGVVVEEDGTTVQDFGLEPRGWAYGTVTDLDNGFPLEGALVEAEDGSMTYTDPDGSYELWLDPGLHQLTASAQDYAPETQWVLIVSGVGKLKDFSLEAAIAFVPSPIEVSVPLGGYHTEPATIYNRLPTDYAFMFRERGGGWLPLATGETRTLNAPAGPAQAADGTAVAQGYTARPAGTVAIQPRYPMADGPNVLLVNADDDNDGYSPIHDFLQAYGDLGLIDLFDGRYATPTLEQLQAYDVVVTWANYVYSNATAMGDVLADYVDEGGKVIDLMFALDPNWGLAGRWINENYTAIRGSGTSYVNSCLGDYDPNHPIMDGVTNVCDLYRLYGTYMTEGSYEVARWQDSELFVAAKEDQSVASINGYVGVYYQWTGEMVDMLHNAILWLAVPADVLWLSEDPAEGVVPAEGSLPVDILFDANPGAGVVQPGLYWADLKVDGEDVDVTVPVRMTVEAPQGWGRLEGTVQGLGYCDQNPGVLEEAQVMITGSSGASWTVETDEMGHYAIWLDSAENPLTLDVTFPEHLPGQATGVMIVPGGNVVVDFDLRWDGPCLSLEPLSLDTTLDMGDTDTQQITLTNDGAGEGTFEVSDLEKDYVPMRQGFLPAAERPAGLDTDETSTGRAPDAPVGLPNGAGPMAGAPGFAVDVYPGYNLVTFDAETPGSWTVVAPLPGNGYFAGDFINGDFSTLYVIDYNTNSLYRVDTTTGAVTLVGPSTPYGGESWTGMTGSVDGTMYASSTDINRSTLYTVDLDTGAVTVVGQITNAPAIIDIAITPDGEMYGVDIVNDNLVQIDPATGAGTVIGYIGFNANYAQGMDYEEESGVLYLAAYDGSVGQGQLRIADPETGNTILLGAFPGGAEVDSLGWATGGGADAPWLYEDPVSGAVPPDGGLQVIDVTFDAGMVTQPGTYTGEVHDKTNDPVNKTFVVNATMNVIGPQDWGRVEGTVQSLGYCDQNPEPLKGALVTIDGGLVLETDQNGHYSVWLEQGSHEFVVTADDHVGASATVVVIAQQTVYQDFDLRSIQPCMSVTPLSFEVTVAQGASLTEILTLVNAGAGDSEFKLREKRETLMGATAPAGASTAAAPEGYVPALTVSESKGSHPLGGTVAIFKDANPWGSVATETFLSANGIPYEVHTSAEFGSLDFANYGMIVFSGDQPTSFYDAYANYVSKFEDYVDQGGFLNFFSCDAGWNGGTLTAPLPGGMSWTGWVYDNYNVIDDPAHPVVQGVPNPFYGNYASHGHFGSLPGEAHVIASEQTGGQPTIVEYPIGAGWLIAFGQPLEISYDYGWDAGLIFGNTLLWGYQFEPALDIPWVEVDPMEGMVPADSSVDVDVTFVVTPGMPVGTYNGTLVVTTGDEGNPKVNVPLTLHVITGENTIHVGGIEGFFVLDYLGRPVLLMHVLVNDQALDPMGDVLVDASLWAPDGGPYQRGRYTKPTGNARFHWGSMASGMWTICVDDLTLAGYVYNPDDNVVTCMDWQY